MESRWECFLIYIQDVSLDTLREFLLPHDRVTRLLTSTRNVGRTRADFTCEWFDRHLADFMRSGKDVLIVSGKPRSGKSLLSDWTIERLQTLSGRRASEVVSYTIGMSTASTQLKY